MHQFVFKSRWIAIGFAALILVSVYSLVGAEGEDSMLTRMQGNLVDQVEEPGVIKADLEGELSDQPDIPDYDSAAFTPDDELLDDASGFATEPEIEYDPFEEFEEYDEAGMSEAEDPFEDDVVLVEDYVSEAPTPRSSRVEQPEFINGIPVRIVQQDDQR